MQTEFKLRRWGRIALLTVDNGEDFTKPTTLNLAAWDSLGAALDELESGDWAGLLLTGKPFVFCAGADIGMFEAAEGPEDALRITRRGHEELARLRALPFPTVAAINGVAAGAGLNIALHCDIVLAARSARFIQSFAKIGLVPDAGGTWVLPRLIGMARARGLALLAEPLSAERAEQWGLIWRCVDDNALIYEARRICEHFSIAPTQGLALIKRALDASAGNTLDAQLDLERDLQAVAREIPDYAEGVRAFMEKRKPKFSGRRGND